MVVVIVGDLLFGYFVVFCGCLQLGVGVGLLMDWLGLLAFCAGL